MEHASVANISGLLLAAFGSLQDPNEFAVQRERKVPPLRRPLGDEAPSSPGEETSDLSDADCASPPLPPLLLASRVEALSVWRETASADALPGREKREAEGGEEDPEFFVFCLTGGFCAVGAYQRRGGGKRFSSSHRQERGLASDATHAIRPLPWH